MIVRDPERDRQARLLEQVREATAYARLLERKYGRITKQDSNERTTTNNEETNR